MILIFAFLVGGWPGRKITQLLSVFMRHQPKYLWEISGAQNYPYYYLYRNRIVSLFDKSEAYLRKYRPSVPVVYVYG
jgi:hypothetical protein